MSDEPTNYEPLEPPAERVAYYEARAKQVTDAFPHRFDAFARGSRDLVMIGDERIRSRAATGYNLVREHGHFPLDSDRPLLFYSMYIAEPQHLGRVLAEMEVHGLIAETEVRFGVKASKTAYEQDWPIDPAHEELGQIIGVVDTDPPIRQVSKSVETVVIFQPRSQEHALQLAYFLLSRCDADRPDHIEGSWRIPDIRATHALEEQFRETPGFEVVVANIIGKRTNQARVIALRKSTQYDAHWQAQTVVVNEKLGRYVSSAVFGVPD